MNEVKISKRRLFLWLVLVVSIVGLTLSFPVLRQFLPTQAFAQSASVPTATSTPDVDREAQAAALAGAQAFYTVNYQDQQGWVEKLCAVSTEIGCSVDRNILVPTLWPGFFKGETATTVQTKVLTKVVEQELSSRGNAHAQVWNLQINLSAPWPQQGQPVTQFQALALVIQEKGGWKFERFLTEDEALVYGKGN